MHERQSHQPQRPRVFFIVLFLCLSLAAALATTARAEGEDTAATLNGTTYATVQVAIDAANNDDTVTLQKDCIEQLTITKPITLDLNGKNYTYTGSGSGITINNHAVPTIKNGNVSGCTTQVITASDAGVNLDSVTLKANSGTAPIVSVTDYGATTALSWSNVTFQDNTSAGVASIAYKADSTFTSCTFTNNAGDSSSNTSNSVLCFGGMGTPTLSSCTFSGNSRLSCVVSGMDLIFNGCKIDGNTDIEYAIHAQGYRRGSIAMTSSQVTGNKVSKTTVYSHYNSMTPNTYNDTVNVRVSLTDSVIKNNVSTAAYRQFAAGLYANYYGLSLTRSAVYGNTNEAGGSADFAFWMSPYYAEIVPTTWMTNEFIAGYVGLDLTQMKDPTDTGQSFSNYSIDAATGRAIINVPIYQAQIGETKYETFAKAWAAAQSGDTIKITNADSGGNPAALAIDSLDTSGKDVTIDLDGHVLASGDDGKSLVLTGTGTVRLTNSSTTTTGHVRGTVDASAEGTIDIGSNVELASSLNTNGGKVTISGEHENLQITCPASYSGGTARVTNPVTFADDFSYTGDGTDDQAFSINLSDGSLASALNDITGTASGKVSDFVIAQGLSADDAAKLQLTDITNPLVSVTASGGQVSVHKDEGAVVYLNGEAGNDDSDGSSKDQAVKTFEQARTMIEAKLYPKAEAASPVQALASAIRSLLGATIAQAAEGGTAKQGYIIVCGTVSVSSAGATWSPSEAHPDLQITLLRDPDFTGALASVSGSGASLSLRGIILDGNKSHVRATSSLISVSNGATLNIQDGAVLQNNENTTTSGAGAVYVSGGTLKMEGGTISGNSAPQGSAVHMWGSDTSTFELTGGIIQGNSYIETNDASGAGAVFVEGRSDFTMSGGAISGNTGQQGGGVTVVDWGLLANVGGNQTATFKMTGGSITNNRAVFGAGSQASEGCGGGIYSYSNGVRLEGGTIEENEAENNGGAVYSEGSDSSFSTLTITNALITGNHATKQGGGVWACPTGSVRLGNDVLVSGNAADEVGDDYVGAAVSRGRERSLPTSGLGGSLVAWYKDGALAFPYNAYPTSDTSSVPRYADQSEKILADGYVACALKSVVAEDGMKAAWAAQKLLIRGNKAARGGGIGTNGGVVSEPVDVVNIKVTKTWIGAAAPDKLDVALWLDGYKVQTAELSESNNWSHTFENVPANSSGSAIKAKVTEDLTSGWTQSTLEVTDDGDSAVPNDQTVTVDGTMDEGYALVDTTKGVSAGSASVPTVQTWVFTNKHVDEPTPNPPTSSTQTVSIDPPLTKTITGDAPAPASTPTFTFEVTARDGAPMPADANSGKVIRAIRGAGTTEIGRITYDRVGTYVYDVVEQAGSAAGWTYDVTHYVMTVEVGGLSVQPTVTYAKVDGNGATEPAGSLTFTNDYQGPATSVTIEAKKALSTGEAPAAGAYAFELWRVDADGNREGDAPVARATNAADGAITFPALTYKLSDLASTGMGTWHYVIHEASERVANWTNAPDVAVTVRVTLTEDGTLHAEVTYGEGDAATIEPPTMTNIYTPPEEPGKPEQPTTPEPSTPLTGRLPQTGEAHDPRLIAAVGAAGIAFMAAGAIQRRRENRKPKHAM